MPYPTTPLAGVDLTGTTAGTETDGEDAVFALGTVITAHDGQLWMYVQASGAITQYDAVGVDENYQAAALTAAMLNAGHRVGFAQNAFSDNDFGWVAIAGSNINVRVVKSCVADTALYATATDGVLDDAVTTETDRIEGVVTVATANTDTVSPKEVLATSVHAATPGGGT